MRVIEARNVEEALPRAVSLMAEIAIPRDSRNGAVLYGGSVSTVYSHPLERVIFWPQRDANPFFHLYESLWMLAGRRDIKPLLKFVKSIGNYSDDGVTFHGAYGYRWREFFDIDQLQIIIKSLKKDPEGRRNVLQMWDPCADLGLQGADFPCNVSAVFGRGVRGELNLSMFCRSNDIVFGCYGANAVQFGTLLEYMALAIGCPVGTYTQISINWHAYVETFEQVMNVTIEHPGFTHNRYALGEVVVLPMIEDRDKEFIDHEITKILKVVDEDFKNPDDIEKFGPWGRMVFNMMYAHYVFKQGEVRRALEILHYDDKIDWVVAGREWLQRRVK